MSDSAQSEVSAPTEAPVQASTEVAQPDSSPSVDHLEQVPESFNIFSDELAEDAQGGQAQEEESQPRKSKQFLDNLRKDREVRKQEIALKQRQAQLDAREMEVRRLAEAKQKLNEDPSEFLRSQGIDPMEYYRRWTEKMISDQGELSIETKMSDTQRELHELKARIASKEAMEEKKRADNARGQAYSGLCNQIEKFATGSEGYETIKETCTANDIANGMVAHYRKTGEELTIEEAFEKIESGLRQREESFYSDPKIVQKLQRYNPEAIQRARSPQATLSAKWKETTTRQAPDDMSYEEVREMYKGKLFT